MELVVAAAMLACAMVCRSVGFQVLAVHRGRVLVVRGGAMLGDGSLVIRVIAPVRGDGGMVLGPAMPGSTQLDGRAGVGVHPVALVMAPADGVGRQKAAQRRKHQADDQGKKEARLGLGRKLEP